MKSNLATKGIDWSNAKRKGVDKKLVGVWMDRTLIQKLETKADELETSKNQVIVTILKDAVEKGL